MSRLAREIMYYLSNVKDDYENREKTIDEMIKQGVKNGLV